MYRLKVTSKEKWFVW